MASLISFSRRVWAVGHPPEVPKSSDAIRIGLLGASAIAPAAVILPAKSHPDVIIAAIAARDERRAQAYAKKHGIPKVYKSYQDILDDSTINAVYIPLPNNHHYEWSVKALRAGKHVLLEKPCTSNATEARSLFNLHSTLPNPAPVLLEAFHYKFHPGWQKFLSLLDPPSITSALSILSAPAGFMKSNDIRFQYKLSGGAFMDMGCYTISTLRGAFAADPEECISATTFPVKKAGGENCDKAFKASFRFPNGGVGDAQADLSKGEWWMPVVEIPKIVVKHKEVPVADDAGLREGQSHHKTRTVTFWNFIVPFFWHRIDVMDEHVIKGADGQVVKKWASKESIKSYTWGDLQQEGTTRVGEEYWSTYRHMLEQFVNRIKGRQGSGVWTDGEESIKIMEAIDSGYTKAGLPLRPTSEYM